MELLGFQSLEVCFSQGEAVFQKILRACGRLGGNIISVLGIQGQAFLGVLSICRKSAVGRKHRRSLSPRV